MRRVESGGRMKVQQLKQKERATELCGESVEMQAGQRERQLRKSMAAQ